MEMTVMTKYRIDEFAGFRFVLCLRQGGILVQHGLVGMNCTKGIVSLTKGVSLRDSHWSLYNDLQLNDTMFIVLYDNQNVPRTRFEFRYAEAYACGLQCDAMSAAPALFVVELRGAKLIDQRVLTEEETEQLKEVGE